MSCYFNHSGVVSWKFETRLRTSNRRAALLYSHKWRFAFHRFYGRFRCFKPPASYWPCPKPSFEITWLHFSSLVLKLSFKITADNMGTKNAKTLQESRAPRPAKGRRECHEAPRKREHCMVGGKPSGAILFFLKASNNSFLYQDSQKLLDFWPTL